MISADLAHLSPNQLQLELSEIQSKTRPDKSTRKRQLETLTVNQLLSTTALKSVNLSGEQRIVRKSESFPFPGGLRTLFRSSSSFREFQSLTQLLELNIPCFVPVLAHEVRRGPLIEQTSLITIEVPDGINLSKWFRDPQSQKDSSIEPQLLLKELPKLLKIFSEIHKNGFYGQTLFAKNIFMVIKEGSLMFYLYDLPRSKNRPNTSLHFPMASYDLACLDRWAHLWLSRSQRLRLLKVYLKELNLSPDWKRWAKKIELRRQRFLRETFLSWASHWVRRRLKQVPIIGKWVR